MHRKGRFRKFDKSVPLKIIRELEHIRFALDSMNGSNTGINEMFGTTKESIRKVVIRILSVYPKEEINKELLKYNIEPIKFDYLKRYLRTWDKETRRIVVKLMKSEELTDYELKFIIKLFIKEIGAVDLFTLGFFPSIDKDRADMMMKELARENNDIRYFGDEVI